MRIAAAAPTLLSRTRISTSSVVRAWPWRIAGMAAADEAALALSRSAARRRAGGGRALPCRDQGGGFGCAFFHASYSSQVRALETKPHGRGNGQIFSAWRISASARRWQDSGSAERRRMPTTLVPSSRPANWRAWQNVGEGDAVLLSTAHDWVVLFSLRLRNLMPGLVSDPPAVSIPA